MSRRALLLCLLLLGLAGCVQANPTNEDSVPADQVVPPSVEPIVFPNPQAPMLDRPGRVLDDVPVDADDQGWREKLQLATGYASGGFDDEALAVIRRALHMGPPHAWAQRFKDLRATLQVRRLETTLLRVDVRGDKDYVPFEQDVLWRIRIRNVSSRQIVIGPPEGGSPTALTLEVDRRDIDIYAAELRRSWTQNVALPSGSDGCLRIAPGGSHDMEVALPASDVGGAISGLKILQVSGQIRATLREGKDDPRAVSLPLRAGRVAVLPNGFEPLTRDPIASMRRAREAVAPTHLLVAAEFVTSERLLDGMQAIARALEIGDPALRTAALGALGILTSRAVGRSLAPLAEPFVLALGRTPDRQDAMMDALATLSDTRLPADARLWQDWWRRAKERGDTVPATGRGG